MQREHSETIFFRCSRAAYSVMGSDRNSNSSMLLCMSCLPIRVKMIKWKINALYYNIIQLYFRHSWAANSVVDCRMWPKLNSFKLLWLSLLPARMRKVHLKTKALEWSQQICHCKSRSSGAANTTVWGWFYFKFKLIQAFMVFLATCKNEEDPIKDEDARVITTLSINF